MTIGEWPSEDPEVKLPSSFSCRRKWTWNGLHLSQLREFLQLIKRTLTSDLIIVLYHSGKALLWETCWRLQQKLEKLSQESEISASGHVIASLRLRVVSSLCLRLALYRDDSEYMEFSKYMGTMLVQHYENNNWNEREGNWQNEIDLQGRMKKINQIKVPAQKDVKKNYTN